MSNRVIQHRYPTTDALLSSLTLLERRQARQEAARWMKVFLSAECATVVSHGNWHSETHNVALDCQCATTAKELAAQACVDDVRQALNADTVLLFLIATDTEGELVLESIAADAFQGKATDVRLAYRSVSQEGHAGPLVELGPITGGGAGTFFNAVHKSIRRLDVPMYGRKGQLRGILVISRDADDPLGDFSDTDRLVATLLADNFSDTLDHIVLSETLQEVVAALDYAGDERDVLDIIVQYSVTLIGGNRGDLVLWDETRKDVIIGAQCGAQVPILVGDVAPNPSIIRDVWVNGGHRYVASVDGVNGYYDADSRTRSELVLRFDWNERAVGVLNVESYMQNGFDSYDVQWLTLLGQCAAGAVVRSRKDSGQLGVSTRLLEKAAFTTDTLKYLLEGVKAYSGCDAAIIYCADYVERELRGVAFLGCDDMVGECRRVRFRFGDNALVCKVFHDKLPYFTNCPGTDPVVSGAGLELFRITGPLAGIPLLYEDRAIGVLVVWSRNGAPPTPAIKDRLGAIVQLAAPSLACSSDVSVHDAIATAADDILKSRQASRSDRELIETAVNRIHCTGFDRVRLFKYEPTDCVFLPSYSAGLAAPQRFLDGVIHVAENAYARHTVATAIGNSKARVYRSSMFGRDPACDWLETPADGEWMVVPLVVHDRVYGEIIVDNAKTRREFTRKEREYLTFLGTLLAETLAHVESVEAMRQRALPVLMKHLSAQDSFEAYIRRLLSFMTCGEGLGFSRALYLSWDERGKRLVYFDGVGCLTGEEFESITKGMKQQRLTLDEVLRRAVSVSDERLHMAMVDFALAPRESDWHWLLARERPNESRRAMDLHSRAADVPANDALVALAEELAHRIGGNHCLGLPMYIGEVFSGLFVVDRSFQGRQITDTDYVKLESFAELAEFLLTERARQRRFFQWLHEDAVVGQLVKNLPAEVGVGQLEKTCQQIESVREHLANRGDITNGGMLDDIYKCVTTVASYVRAIEALQASREIPRQVKPSELVADVVRPLRDRAKRQGILICTHISDNGTEPALYACVGRLGQAIYEIVNNAMEALERSKTTLRRIDIDLECKEGAMVVEVRDTGPGMPSEVYEARRNDMKDSYTSDSNKGLGFGLLHAQTVVECIHNGTFAIGSGDERCGTKVTMRIPMQAQVEDRPQSIGDRMMYGNSVVSR